ncbi:MAG: SURF1 family protein [Actinobacteria bacterium]|nr:SURF1 family protein [Actinomycetota bacterium]
MSRTSAPPVVRWAAYVGVAILFAIACAYLSNWQFSRNAERSTQLALLDGNYDAQPVSLATLIPEGGTFSAADEWRPVTLTGTYLADSQLLARNRVHAGTAAYEILVPFQLADGRVFLVNRGWEPPGNTQSLPDDIPSAPSGEVTVVVRLKPGEALPSSGRGAPDGQVPTINLPLIAEDIGSAGARLEQSAYGLLVSESPAPSDAPQGFEEPSIDPGPFLSYAVQWVLFAVMGFVFIGYVIRSERRARREDAEDAAEAAAIAASTDAEQAAIAVAAVSERRKKVRDARKPRDRDAEDEDSLLDSARR